MANMKWQGLEEYELQLTRIRDASPECIGEAIHEGAGIIADAVRENINAIPVDNRFVRKGQMLTGISQPQKDGLLESFGIAPMQDDNGYINVKLGFDGYNGVKTKSYPNGQPNSVIARSVNAGTSFRVKIPFVDNAINAKKSEAENAIKNKFDEALERAL